MNQISEIIIRAVRSNSSIVLPGLGTLITDRQPSREDRGKLYPPFTAVTFQPYEQEGVPSVVDQLNEYYNDRDRSIHEYSQWLDASRTNDGFAFDGIGRISGGVFTPEPELNRELNPVADPVKVKKPFSLAEKVWLGLIGLFVIILVGGWYHYYSTDISDGKFVERAVDKVEQLDRISDNNASILAQSEQIDVTQAPISGEAEQIRSSADAARIQAAPQNSQPTASATSVSKKKYHVVGGVFSTTQNADKYISQTKKKYPDLNFSTLDYKNGKTLVSIYSGDNEADVNAKKTSLSRQTGNYDLWVYRAE